MEAKEETPRKRDMDEEEEGIRDMWAWYDLFYEDDDLSPHVNLTLCGQSVTFILDTGSPRNCITRELARSLNLESQFTSSGDEYVMGVLNIDGL